MSVLHTKKTLSRFAAQKRREHAVIQRLEDRRLFSASLAVSAQLNLLSISGPASKPVYQYSVSLADTGNTNVGTFWFAWVPGEDYLPSAPLSVSSPAGWVGKKMGGDDSSDGTSIQWIAGSDAAAETPGQTLSTFQFTTHDSPAALNGDSPTHPGVAVGTSYVYSGQPFSDSGDNFQVAAVPPSATQTSVAGSNKAVNVGDRVTFTATVAAQTSGLPNPTGTVSFVLSGNTLGVATIQTNGKAVFSTTTLPAGVDDVTAVYTGSDAYTGSDSTAFAQTVHGANHLVVATQPTNTIAGQTINPDVVIDLDGATGHVDGGDNADVTIAIFSGPKNATLMGTSTVAAVNGVATFPGLSLDEAGKYMLLASSSGLGSAKSGHFTVSPDASSSQLVLTQQPAASAVVGHALTPQIVAEVEDQFGNLITSNSSKVILSISSGPGGGAISGTTSVNATGGIAKFKTDSLTVAGSYTLELSDSSLAVTTLVTFDQTITQGASTLGTPRVSASYVVGKTIDLNAMLKSSATGVDFTGNATLSDLSGTLGTVSVSASGAISFSVSGLTVGQYSCTIAYAGDANHTSVTSQTFIINVVSDPPAPSFPPGY